MTVLKSLFSDLLTSPEDHQDAYIWAAVLLSHAAIGFILVAVVASWLGAWRSALVLSVAYAVGWEGAQVLLYGGTIADGAVDAAALACGAILAASLWERRLGPLWAVVALLAAIGVSGWGKRK